MLKTLFFDHAATTPCCPSATAKLLEYSEVQYGNPSSSHRLGQDAARAVRDARVFFADQFRVTPEQVIFTGSGTESDNLAIYGIALGALTQKKLVHETLGSVIVSEVEHPAVRRTALSLKDLGFDVRLTPVTQKGELNSDALIEAVDPATLLVSVMRVNNITGAVFAVDQIAESIKKKAPHCVFHTDAIQALGKVTLPDSSSKVDLLSLSGHKINGPKGIGALIILNKNLLDQRRIRPLLWGGEQEAGLRSGTQSAALIAAFHAAAREALSEMDVRLKHTQSLRARLHLELKKRKLLLDGEKSPVCWNSPDNAVPHIVSLSFPGFPSGALAKYLEERGCLVSTGSACSSGSTAPDPVLKAMGFSPSVAASAIRVSLSPKQEEADILQLVQAIEDSMHTIRKLLSGGAHASRS